MSTVPKTSEAPSVPTPPNASAPAPVGTPAGALPCAEAADSHFATHTQGRLSKHRYELV